MTGQYRRYVIVLSAGALIGALLAPAVGFAASTNAEKGHARQAKKPVAVRTVVLRLIPRRLIEQVYPPRDELAQSYPPLFMTASQRTAIEKKRLAFYEKRYGLAKPKKKKRAKQRRQAHHVAGIVRGDNGEIMVNLDGRFYSLRRLLKGRAYRVLSFEQDRLKFSTGGRTYSVMVGERWRLGSPPR